MIFPSVLRRVLVCIHFYRFYRQRILKIKMTSFILKGFQSFFCSFLNKEDWAIFAEPEANNCFCIIFQVIITAKKHHNFYFNSLLLVWKIFVLRCDFRWRSRVACKDNNLVSLQKLFSSSRIVRLQHTLDPPCLNRGINCTVDITLVFHACATSRALPHARYLTRAKSWSLVGVLSDDHYIFLLACNCC